MSHTDTFNPLHSHKPKCQQRLFSFYCKIKTLISDSVTLGLGTKSFEKFKTYKTNNLAMEVTGYGRCF